MGMSLIIKKSYRHPPNLLKAIIVSKNSSLKYERIEPYKEINNPDRCVSIGIQPKRKKASTNFA